MWKEDEEGLEWDKLDWDQFDEVMRIYETAYQWKLLRHYCNQRIQTINSWWYKQLHNAW